MDFSIDEQEMTVGKFYEMCLSQSCTKYEIGGDFLTHSLFEGYKMSDKSR